MRLKANKNTILILSGALGLAIVCFGLMIWLQQAALGRTLAELKRRETELADGQQIARRRELVEAARLADIQQLAFLENGVTDAAYVPTLLKQLEELAIGTDNRVLGVRPQVNTQAPSRVQQRRDPEAQGSTTAAGSEKKAEVPPPYSELLIQVNLVGSFQSTQLFLDRLTRFPKIVSVGGMQVRPHRATDQEPDGANTLLDVEVKLTAYIMKEKAPAGSVPGQSALTASAALGGSR